MNRMTQRRSYIDVIVERLEEGLLLFNQDVIKNSYKMEKELGFFDAEEYWLFNRVFETSNGMKLSFDFEIFKENTLEDSKLCILDEEVLQPYEYEKYCSDTIFEEIEDKVKYYINWLIDNEVIIDPQAGKFIKVRPKYEYEMTQFIYTKSEESLKNIYKLFEKNGVEVLKVEQDEDCSYPDPNWCMYLFVKNKNWELDTITIKDNWYIWVDEIGLVNSCGPEYFKDNYEITSKKDEIDKLLEEDSRQMSENLRYKLKRN